MPVILIRYAAFKIPAHQQTEINQIQVVGLFFFLILSSVFLRKACLLDMNVACALCTLWIEKILVWVKGAWYLYILHVDLVFNYMLRCSLELCKWEV